MLKLAQQGRIPGAQQGKAGRWSLPSGYKVDAPPQRARRLDKIKHQENP